MAAQEEAGARGGNLCHRLPRLHVDDRHLPFLEVRRREHRPPVEGPGDAGAEMREPRQVDFGDLPAHVEIDHLARMAVAGGADQVIVGRVEKEIVEDAVEHRAPDRVWLR